MASPLLGAAEGTREGGENPVGWLAFVTTCCNLVLIVLTPFSRRRCGTGSSRSAHFTDGETRA